jgi:outer membrane protein OmpA-like peptidoglycan-associated protein
MKGAGLIGIVAGCAMLVVSVITVHGEVRAAAKRLKTGATEDKPKVAIADDAEAPYCTPSFKSVLQRTLQSCGLVGQDSRRGCQPADVKTLAQISDDDFNALFTPLKGRGAVIMFDESSDKLDDDAKKVVEELWQDRRGARYFFIVARASKTGTAEFNRTLSHKRGNSLTFDLNDKFHDPDLDKQVGLLWLGEEFAQLGPEYCQWNVSRKNKTCNAEAINRSAFASWVDCRL